MYKLCVALAAVLAVATAKPSLDYGYGSYVAPVATSYSAYSAPVYSESVYSAPVYSNYAAIAPIAAAPVAPIHASYAAYPSYPSYSASLGYASEIPTSFLWKKK